MPISPGGIKAWIGRRCNRRSLPAVGVCGEGLWEGWRGPSYPLTPTLSRKGRGSKEATRDAERLDHAQTIGHCLGFAGWLAVFARDAAAAREWADRTIRYCREQRLIFWEASGYLVDGWALIQEGQFHAGVKRMHEGIAIRRAAGAALVHSGFNAILAECHLQAGEYDEAMRQVEEGLAHVARTGERAREAELLRVRGELVLRASHERNEQEAAQYLERAIAVARSQEATLFQLRAATGLARLYRDQGKRVEAIGLLAPVYAAFTEGLDARDLLEARALLDELERAA
jgi:predicted ATPase